MTPKKILLAVSVAALAVLLFCWLRKSQKLSTSDTVAQVSGNKAAIVPGQKSLPKQLPPQEVAAIEQRLLTHEKETMDVLFSTPIDFFGKVIDDKKNPVPAATISISIVDSVTGNNTKFSEKTDNRGEFHISGHGLGVTVQVSKEGYYRTAQSRGTFGYTKTAGQYDPHANTANPAIFVVQKMGQPVPMFHLQKDYLIAKNGTAVEINLSNGQVVSEHGDLKVEAWTNDQGHLPNSNSPYDWRCRISVLGGGLVQRIDKFDFQAPTDGYSLSDEIAMAASSGTAWRAQVTRSYFLQLSGNRYAQLEFQMSAGGDHYFTVNSYLNPREGDRSVEPDLKNPGR